MLFSDQYMKGRRTKLIIIISLFAQVHDIKNEQYNKTHIS